MATPILHQRGAILDLFRIGDRVRRRGLLAEVFGDDVGVVIAVRRGRFNGVDEFEVDFGSRRTRLHINQLTVVGTVDTDLPLQSSGSKKQR